MNQHRSTKPALLIFSLALSLVLSLLPLGVAGAQSRLREEAGRRLHLTERVLEQADRSVQGCNDPRAQQLLSDAHARQDAAVQFFNAGRYPQAMNQTEEARAQADRARQICAGPGGGGGNIPLTANLVSQELDRTDQILSRVVQVLRESGNNHAQVILDHALQLQQNARERFNGGEFKPALNQTRKARDSAQEALNLATQGRQFNPDRLAEELRQTDEQIATAVEWSQTPAGAGSLDQLNAAKSLEEHARRLYDQRDFLESLRFTMRARDIVRNVLDGPANVDPAELQRTLQQADAALNRARAATLSGEAARLRDRAESRYSRALEEQQNGHLNVALLNARAALTLALRAQAASP